MYSVRLNERVISNCIYRRIYDSRGESINAMVQQQLLSALAGTETIEGVDASKLLFILGGAFPRIDDLKKENGKNPELPVSTKDEKIDWNQSMAILNIPITLK